VTDISYAYGALDVTRVTNLPSRLAWVSHVSGIWSNQPLPDTERLSLGGLSAVRGYNYDDVSADAGLIWRNELRLPGFSPLQKAVGRPDTLSPYLFADLGYGKDQATKASSTLAGIGAGFDYAAGDNFSGSLVAGYALKDAGTTGKGDWSVQVSLTAKF
jgi:hemolysin activation/secretion protein